MKKMRAKAGRKNISIKKLSFEKKNIPAIFAVVLLSAVFVFFGTSILSQNADINRLEKQREQINAEYEQQIEENEKLQAVLDNENKDDYIEQKAREKGYVKSDEIVFYDISAGE